jgi:AcrR family transcriptional regulator
MAAAEIGFLGEPAGERDRLLRAFIGLACVDSPEPDPARVCRRAGLPPTAFARHFASVSECSQAAWDRLEAIYLRRLALSYEGIDEWRGRLRAAILETLRLCESHPDAASFLLLGLRSASLRQRRRALLARLAEQLEHSAPHPAPEGASRLVLGTIFDRIYRYLRFDGGPGSLQSTLPALMFLAVSVYLGPEAGLEELRTVAS